MLVRRDFDITHEILNQIPWATTGETLNPAEKFAVEHCTLGS